MKDEIQNAIKSLNEGGVIICPTETVLGIGCQSQNPAAIRKVYQIKKRDKSKPMLVLVDSISMIKRYKRKLSTLETELLLSDEPTTVIIDEVEGISNELTGPNSSLAFRITKHQICVQLIKGIDQPLVSTSANLSGKQAPLNFNEIDKQVAKMIDYILKDDSIPSSKKPSRILKVVNNNINYIRK